jgi:phospholipase C
MGLADNRGSVPLMASTIQSGQPAWSEEPVSGRESNRAAGQSWRGRHVGKQRSSRPVSPIRAGGGVAVCLLASAVLAACAVSLPGPAPAGPLRVAGGSSGTYVIPPGIHKIKHVIVVMQENRSFDSYFGTFPGADGIPVLNRVPAVCVPIPGGGCTVPYHDSADVNGGGPHAMANAVADVDGGRMDGFIRERYAARRSCHIVVDPACASSPAPDVMGYHTAPEIPNYWAYASQVALDDHMFEPVKSWSLAEHLYLVSGWSAKCRTSSPSCASDISGSYGVEAFDNALTPATGSSTTRSCPATPT